MSKKPAVKAEQKKTTVNLFVMFAMKVNNPIKTQITSLEDGVNILRDVEVCIKKKKPYLNGERGILVNHEEINSVYVIAEQVQ